MSWDDECRYFVEDDGSSYMEEQGIIHKRWPKPVERKVEEEPTEDQLMAFVKEVNDMKRAAEAESAHAAWVARRELLEKIKAIWEGK